MVPHKSRSPDAMSKPSHPQYFHIKEHSQHKQRKQRAPIYMQPRVGPGFTLFTLFTRLARLQLAWP